MQIDFQATCDRAASQEALVGRLLGLAEDTDRAGFRLEASMIVALVYSLLDHRAEVGAAS